MNRTTRWPHPVRVLAAVAVALCAALVAVAPSGAQEEQPATVTWGISPAGAGGRDTRSAIEHVVEPGEELVDHVVVDNYGETPISLDLYAGDARPADGAFDVVAADEPSTSVGAWIELDRDRIEVPARDHVIVAVTVRVPDDAEPGDHAGGVLASRRAAGVGDDVGIETERRVGARVHLRVAGPVAPELSVEHLDPGYGHRFLSLAPGRVEVAFRVRNTGNIRLSGATRVTVRGPFGLGERSAPGPEVEDLLPGHWVDQRVVVEGVWPLVRLDVEVEATPTHSARQPLDGAVEAARAGSRLWALPYAAAAAVGLLVAAIVTWWVRRRRARSGADGSEPGDGSEPDDGPELGDRAGADDEASVATASP